MDKKNLSFGLIILSIIALLLSALDFFVNNVAPLGLGAETWVLIAIVLGIYGVYVKQD